jgi:hypothetical protein
MLNCEVRSTKYVSLWVLFRESSKLHHITVTRILTNYETYSAYFSAQESQQQIKTYCLYYSQCKYSDYVQQHAMFTYILSIYQRFRKEK